MTKGLIYIFTGEGKGKTSAALGVAMRAVGHGKRVVVVQWYKTSSKLKVKSSKLRIYAMGKGFYFKNDKYTDRQIAVDRASEEDHRRAAQAALEKARELLSKNNVESPAPGTRHPALFLLVLDEVINAVNDELIDPVDLINLISKRGKSHVILTGRGAPDELIEIADLVTEMKKIKHPFDKGRKAVIGLDF